MLRVPVLVHLGYVVDDILDRYRHRVVGHAVLIDMRRVDRRDAWKTYQLPAGLVAVPAIDRMGEEALQRVPAQHGEETLRTQPLQPDLAAPPVCQPLILM